MKRRFEYVAMTKGELLGDDLTSDILNNYDKWGWELVTVNNCAGRDIYIFRRPYIKPKPKKRK